MKKNRRLTFLLCLAFYISLLEMKSNVSLKNEVYIQLHTISLQKVSFKIAAEKKNQLQNPIHFQSGLILSLHR